MDLKTTLDTLGAQGTAYWAAAAAVALGLTLLAIAGLLQWRRLRERRAGPRAHRPARSAPSSGVLAAYAAQHTPPAAPAAPVPAAENELANRLRAATDRLAAVHAALAARDRLADGSDLKPTASHVEYVFRTGEA